MGKNKKVTALTTTRRAGDVLVFNGPDIEVALKIEQVSGKFVTLYIEAPEEITILLEKAIEGLGSDYEH